MSKLLHKTCSKPLLLVLQVSQWRYLLFIWQRLGLLPMACCYASSDISSTAWVCETGRKSWYEEIFLATIEIKQNEVVDLWVPWSFKLLLHQDYKDWGRISSLTLSFLLKFFIFYFVVNLSPGKNSNIHFVLVQGIQTKHIKNLLGKIFCP